MKKINEATSGSETEVYLYDQVLDVFMSEVSTSEDDLQRQHIGFRPSHHVTVDADMDAGSLDLVMQGILYSEMETFAA